MLRQVPNIRFIGRGPFKEFVDVRLGSAEILLKRIMDAVVGNKGTLIVLDSWDSMAKEMDVVERLKIERSIVAIVEANESAVVFVSEEPSLTTTDYLADAIVTLKDETYKGMRLRIVEWDKLRGCPIPKKRFVFTLNEGRFSMLLGFEGSKECTFTRVHLPEAIDGLDVILFEIGLGVYSKGIEPLIHALMSEFLLKGHSVVTIPIGMETPKKMLERIKRLGVQGRLSVGGFYHYEKEDIFYLDPTSPERIVDTLIEEGDKLGGLCLYIIGCDVLEYFFGKEGLVRLIFKLSRRIREKEASLILLIGQDSESLKELANMSDAHMKFQMVEQALVVYAIKPQGGSLYHVGYAYDEGIPKVEIIPIR